MPTDAPTGVLLIQLGTPSSPSTGDVRRYLREFLSDPRVMDIPAVARALLLNAVILPFRPRRSAHAYRQIWREDGSPLTIHSEALVTEVKKRLGDGYEVVLGMRYQEPSLADALARLVESGCGRVVVFPLFPQYASATTGSALEAALREAAQKWNVPDVTSIGDFFADPGYLGALAESARGPLEEFRPDHVVFSYHGLPESHIRKSDVSGDWCLSTETCCDRVGGANRYCYRAQCFATTAAVVERLGLPAESSSTTFQSRLAGQKWIEPYTDRTLESLIAEGVRRLAVLTPSFTADCLETLEEIGIRGREQWETLGGEAFLLVPCLNSHPLWADTVVDLVRRVS